MKTKITDKIKSFEDAMNATGRPNVPAFVDVPEDLCEYFVAHYKMSVIAEALNDGWKADWNDESQCKYIPWFLNSGVSSGFAFDDTNYDYSIASAGNASRLCFAERELAEYAGREFIEIWNAILMK